MKKFYRLSVCYTILALVGGVFYREFTKINNFTEPTTLRVVHTHAFMLGMFFFLIVLLLEKQFQLTKSKKLKAFLGFYNAGLCLTIVMLLTRGITQVLAITLSNGMNAAISGFAGIGHILLGIGFLYFFKILKERINNAENI